MKMEEVHDQPQKSAIACYDRHIYWNEMSSVTQQRSSGALLFFQVRRFQGSDLYLLVRLAEKQQCDSDGFEWKAGFIFHQGETEKSARSLEVFVYEFKSTE